MKSLKIIYRGLGFSMTGVALILSLSAPGCRNTGTEKFPSSIDMAQRDQNARAVDSVQAQSAGASAVAGQVTLSGPCQPSPVNITVRTNSQTVYEVQVPMGGSFEFHTTPGLYRIAGAGSDGCVADTEATVTSGSVTRIRLVLMRPAPTAGATVASAQSCAWWDSACLARFYPGTGSGIAIFPNVYLSGAEGEAVEVALRLRDHAGILAASPVLGGIRGDSASKFSEGLWNVKLGLWSEDDAGLSINQLQSLNHTYSYLYYDLRFDASVLQSEWGFCAATPRQLIENIKSFVVKNSFPERIVRDVETSLQNKLTGLQASARGVCAFPQDFTELERVTEIQTSPAAQEIKRLWFVITPWNVHPQGSEVLESARTIESARFTRGPLRTLALANLPKRWSQKTKFEEGRTIASDQKSRSLRVYEWGVVFLISSDQPLQKEKN